MRAQLTLMAAAGMVGVVSMILQAATGPGWWIARGVLHTNLPPNDFAVVNQGQLKWMALNAALELESTLPGGAGSNVWALISGFTDSNNFRAVNLGQLKFVAQPFYERLIAVGYTVIYPWLTSTNPPNDFALANIGQMKNLFSFDVATWLGLDTDGDGMTNGWEVANELNPLLNDADTISLHPWAHGLSNLQVYQHPSVLIPDGYSSLQDGVPDWWKITYGYATNTPASTVAPNGLTLAENYEAGTSPNSLRVTLVGEIRWLTKQKDGFDTYQSTSPPKVYLKQEISWSNLIGGNPESDPQLGPGTCTEQYDPLSEPWSEWGTGVGWYEGEPDAVSPTERGGAIVVPDYDDPPNENEPDEPGTQNVTFTLSDEYTTAMLKQYTHEQCPEFTGAFSERSEMELEGWTFGAIAHLSADEKEYTLQKLQYQFLFQPPVTNHTLCWFEVFTPDNDPTNKVFTPRTWTGTGTGTPVFVINPYDHPDQHGTTTVVQVDAWIVLPRGSASSNNNPTNAWLSDSNRFDFQAVAGNSPGPYTLTIQGQVPAGVGYLWTLDSTVGTLSNTNTANPTFVPPASVTQTSGVTGLLKLYPTVNGEPTAAYDQRTLKVYPDHLARDTENFGTGGVCGSQYNAPWSFTRFGTTIRMPTTWNCHGSVLHAYDGSGNGYTSGPPPCVTTWATNTFDYPLGDNATNVINKLKRGDVVAYYSGDILLHSSTSIGGSNTWGANNGQLFPIKDANGTIFAGMESWRWGLRTVYEVADDYKEKPLFKLPYTVLPITRIVIYAKP